MISISEIMTRDPVTLVRFNGLADARKLMQDKNPRHPDRQRQVWNDLVALGLGLSEDPLGIHRILGAK